MSPKTQLFTIELYEYLLKYSLREPPILALLRQETREKFPQSQHMQISPEQGQLMQLLVEIQHAQRTLDIGTFTGYSALTVALALPENGKVYTFDIDANVTQIAQLFWEKANVAEKIELILGPARESLEQMIKNGEGGCFDFAFIDADKNNYEHYYEQCLQLLRPGGLIVIDNVLGVHDKKITDPEAQQKNYLKAIHLLNTKLVKDPRISLSMLPIGDGVTLVRKK